MCSTALVAGARCLWHPSLAFALAASLPRVALYLRGVYFICLYVALYLRGLPHAAHFPCYPFPMLPLPTPCCPRRGEVAMVVQDDHDAQPFRLRHVDGSLSQLYYRVKDVQVPSPHSAAEVSTRAPAFASSHGV